MTALQQSDLHLQNPFDTSLDYYELKGMSFAFWFIKLSLYSDHYKIQVNSDF